VLTSNAHTVAVSTGSEIKRDRKKDEASLPRVCLWRHLD
jgi:hypothetical protein